MGGKHRAGVEDAHGVRGGSDADRHVNSSMVAGHDAATDMRFEHAATSSSESLLGPWSNHRSTPNVSRNICQPYVNTR